MFHSRGKIDKHQSQLCNKKKIHPFSLLLKLIKNCLNSLSNGCYTMLDPSFFFFLTEAGVKTCKKKKMFTLCSCVC